MEQDADVIEIVDDLEEDDDIIEIVDVAFPAIPPSTGNVVCRQDVALPPIAPYSRDVGLPQYPTFYEERGSSDRALPPIHPSNEDFGNRNVALPPNPPSHEDRGRALPPNPPSYEDRGRRREGSAVPPRPAPAPEDRPPVCRQSAGPGPSGAISKPSPSPAQRQMQPQTKSDPIKDLPTSLLDKLCLKYKQKPWVETMKLVRYCMDKPIGKAWKGTLDAPMIHCLEKLQKSVKVRSLTTMLNRLELLSKQKGLEYHISPTGKGCYITSDMFYVEVVVKKNGDVVDVKLAHHGETSTVCEELLRLLSAKNFDAFGENLDGLLAMYEFPGSRDLKAKVHKALQCIEKDLTGISILHRNATNADKVAAVLHGPVGHLVPRSGGSPMSIEYYASPYQLLEEKCNPGSPVLGMNALISVGGTNVLHKLPVAPLLSVAESTSPSNVTFLPLTDEICADLPACFFLTFPQPIPIMLCLLQKIENITGIPLTGAKVASLYDMIIHIKLPEHKNNLVDQLCFHVSLPGVPKQAYLINKGSWKGDVLLGALVSKMHFTHPKHVPLIIEVLRHQCVYNTLISSCASQSSLGASVSECQQFEISPQTDTGLSVTFQNPFGSTLACVSIDVLSSREIECHLHVDAESPLSICTNEFIASILQRCLSIPVTMRAILKKASKIEDVSVMQCSALKTEQPHSPTKQDSPSAGPIIGPTDGLEIPESTEMNVAVAQGNGHPSEACGEIPVSHTLDSNSTDAQPA